MEQGQQRESAPGRWTAERATQWYARQPWLVGANFVPSTACNQLEMWQAGTFDPVTIDRELGWASGIGMNSMRVFLHDLLWLDDSGGFRDRIATYLDIAHRHRISTMLVLFDSVWNPEPKLGPQPEPQPGLHNSQWVQGPGVALADRSQDARLQDYVEDVVGAFATDERVIVWDVWNEPSNTNNGKFVELPNKRELVATLLPEVFAWARNAKPSQPLTAGLWTGAKFSDDPLTSIQLDNSDVVSFHDYSPPARLEERLAELPSDRPILCTEFMARKAGSTFASALPILRRNKVAAYCWGLVAGRSQTIYPWDSWRMPYLDGPPDPWFHDVFHADGHPYREDEAALLREITAG